MKFRIEKKQPVPLLVELLHRHGWTQTDADDWQLLWGAEPPAGASAGGARHANHFKSVILLDNKASLGRLLAAARRRATALGGGAGWEFFPVTYELPFERGEFEADARAHPGRVWIAKPAGGTHGDGQYLFTDPARAPAGDDWIVQHYLGRPHLLDGCKYTLRLYVLLTSLSPLVAHLYTDGLVKRSTLPYRADDLDNRLVHLTNTDVQRLSPTGAPAGLRLADYLARLSAAGADCAALWRAIRSASAHTLLATRDALLHANPPDDPDGIRRFDLLGLDFIVDESLQPWLLEVNTNPSMRVETPAGVAGHAAERRLKLDLLENALHLAGPLAPAEPAPPPAHARGFERLFPVAEAAAWSADWYPHPADTELFARLGFPAPLPPTVPLPPGAVLTTEGLIAFAPGSARLLALNASATTIALLSDEGRRREEIADDLTRHAADAPPRGTVLAQIDDVLRGLWSLRIPVFIRFPALAATPPEPVPPEGRAHCYALGGVRFRVRFAEAAWSETAAAPLAHLRIDDDGTPMHAIEVRREQTWIAVRSPIESFDAGTEAALPAVLHSALLRVGCRMPRTTVAFHAAAVGHAGAALLIAGPSGAGKTTLAAALMGAGFTFFSDEAAILDEDYRVQPVPVALGLLPGALPLLALPAPEGGSVHRRRDGTPVHFLSPRNVSPAPQPVRALVFPRVTPGEPTRLTPLGPVTALTRLGDSGFALPRPLDLERGRALVRWLQHTPGFELTVGSLADAVAVLRELCETPDAGSASSFPPAKALQH